jgi:hypothetical protein
MLKLSSTVQPSWSEGRATRHNFGRGPSNGYFIKILVLIEQMVSDKKIFMGISHRVLC